MSHDHFHMDHPVRQTLAKIIEPRYLGCYGWRMFLSGIADEAGANIDTQIRATKDLGWQNIEARVVEVTGFPKGNIHDIPDAAFDMVCDKLNSANIKINCFGSAIANWGKKIDQPFE